MAKFCVPPTGRVNYPSSTLNKNLMADQGYYLHKAPSQQSDSWALNQSSDLTGYCSQYSTWSPRTRFESNSQVLSDRTKLIANRSQQWEKREVMQPNMLEQHRAMRRQLFQSRKPPSGNPYQVVKVLHGVRADHLTSRVRWDDNKLIKEYFGGNLSDQNAHLHNFDLNSVRMPNFLPPQFEGRIKPKRVSISSVLEINPDQFETSLRSCSRRLKAEKYQYLQRYLNATKWEEIFGRTEMMKLRERKTKLRKQRQHDFLTTIRSRDDQHLRALERTADFSLNPEQPMELPQNDFPTRRRVIMHQ